MQSDPCQGFVLAGGKSSRMGRNKALLMVGGEPLVVRVARELAAVTEAVTLVGDAEIYGSLGFPVISDLYPGCGPLAGIHAALTHSDFDWNLVAACDMPVPARVWSDLLAQPRGGFDAVLPVDETGRLEPLGALYHRRCLPAIAAALPAARYKVTDALAGLRVLQVPFAGPAFRNLNTPEQWREFVSQHV